VAFQNLGGAFAAPSSFSYGFVHKLRAHNAPLLLTFVSHIQSQIQQHRTPSTMSTMYLHAFYIEKKPPFLGQGTKKSHIFYFAFLRHEALSHW
jgi:hypothetical protein